MFRYVVHAEMVHRRRLAKTILLGMCFVGLEVVPAYKSSLLCHHPTVVRPLPPSALSPFLSMRVLVLLDHSFPVRHVVHPRTDILRVVATTTRAAVFSQHSVVTHHQTICQRLELLVVQCAGWLSRYDHHILVTPVCPLSLVVVLLALA